MQTVFISVAEKKSKNLSKGERRRLTLAEELSHGPQTVLLDEPVTELNDKDVAIIISALRELASQNKTVIATLHQVIYIYNVSCHPNTY